MDETPTAPMSPFPPPGGEPVEDVTPTLHAEPDAELVIRSSSPQGRWTVIRERVSAGVDVLHDEAGKFAWAVLGAVVIGALWFLVLGTVAFAFDDGTYWDEQLHLLTQYWYVFVVVVAVAVPAVFAGVRDGPDEAAELVLDRGYWKVVLTGWLLIPMLVASAVFVTSHLVAVLVTLAVIVVVLLVLIVTVGGV